MAGTTGLNKGGSERVLVVAAHPDDEVLGCGATVARHCREGAHVATLILAEGATAREGAGAEAVSQLQEAARSAASKLGVAEVVFGGLPDNRLDTVPLLEVVRIVETVSERVQPSTVYTHFAGDLNLDHRVCARAVLTAFRPLPGASVRRILGFETMSATGWWPTQEGVFEPNVFIEASGSWRSKVAALEAYSSEMRPYPHARSLGALEALARVRGSLVGLEMAEAFVLLRELVPERSWGGKRSRSDADRRGLAGGER